MNTKEQLGVALVGLGYYSQYQLAPALQQTEHCYLAGIVTGTPSKIPGWKTKYLLKEENIYTYETFDAIKNNPDIDIVYIVLPNALHAAFTNRAFAAGKHVICEKPMALSAAECDAMIAASEQAGKYLSIGYRLQYDPYNLEMIRLAKEKVYGEIKSIDTAFAIHAEKGTWRLDKKLSGGGPLMDVGIYCVQAICYITSMQPEAVTAKTYPVSDTEKFDGIEEIIEWQMEMPGGITATCRTSYSDDVGYVKVHGTDGWFALEPAFNYMGLQMQTSDGYTMQLPPLSQQALQMDGIALSIKNNETSKVPGTMGRRDLQIITAIYEAAATGKRVVVSYS